MIISFTILPKRTPMRRDLYQLTGFEEVIATKPVVEIDYEHHVALFQLGEKTRLCISSTKIER